MSIAFEQGNSGGCRRIGLSEFVIRDLAYAPSVFDTAEFASGTRRLPGVKEVVEKSEASSSSSSTSSIGQNSDQSAGGGAGERDEEEVQSVYKPGPLESLEALEEVLPIKRGISRFYRGKSKSFATLSDMAVWSSTEDITKPENAYTRKRKNLLASQNFWIRNSNKILQSRTHGLSKRPTSSRSMVGISTAMNCHGSIKGEETSVGGWNPLPSTPDPATQCGDVVVSAWRSYSSSDLQGAKSSHPHVNI